MQRHDAPQLKGRRAYVPYQQLNTRRHSPAMPLAPRQPPAAVWFVRTRTLALLLHSTEFYTVGSPALAWRLAATVLVASPGYHTLVPYYVEEALTR